MEKKYTLGEMDRREFLGYALATGVSVFLPACATKGTHRDPIVNDSVYNQPERELSVLIKQFKRGKHNAYFIDGGEDYSYLLFDPKKDGQNVKVIGGRRIVDTKDLEGIAGDGKIAPFKGIQVHTTRGPYSNVDLVATWGQASVKNKPKYFLEACRNKENNDIEISVKERSKYEDVFDGGPGGNGGSGNGGGGVGGGGGTGGSAGG